MSVRRPSSCAEVVTNDVLSPTDIGRQAEGEPVSPPTTYRATSGQWAPGFQVRLYRDINDDDPSDDIVYYTGRTPAGNLVIKRGSDVVFDITAWTESGTLAPRDPEMMFTVDANKGQVDFAIPMPTLGSTSHGYPPQQAVASGGAQRGRSGCDSQSRLCRRARQPCQSGARSERVLGPDWTVGRLRARFQYALSRA